MDRTEVTSVLNALYFKIDSSLWDRVSVTILPYIDGMEEHIRLLEIELDIMKQRHGEGQ